MSRFVPVGHEAHDACFAEEASQVLAGAGLRVTRPRRAVVELLERSREPLDAAQVHRELRSMGIHVDRASVYRVLSVLEEQGLVHRVLSTNGFMACHPPAHVHLGRQGEPPDASCHHHVMCRACHKTIEIHCDGMAELLAAVQASTGFKVERHALEIGGLCAACQAPKA